MCLLVYLSFLQSVFSRLLFPALVAPAMTTCTPLRSRSPLLSSFRCRSISACRSHNDLSTVCVWGGEIRQRRDRIWQSLCIQLHFLGLVKGISVLWRKKRRVVTRRLDEKWVTDWSLSACDWSGNLQYNASTIRCFSYGENFKLLESLDWLEHIDSSNLGWLEIKHEKTINIT